MTRRQAGAPQTAPDTNLAPERSPRTAELYAGAQFACYAEVGAIGAGADGTSCDAYAAFGEALGTGTQIVSDLGELCAPPPVHDLLTHKATVPIAHALAALTGTKQERLRNLLRRGGD